MISSLRKITTTMTLTMMLFGSLLAADFTYKQGQEAYDSGDFKTAESIWRQLAETGDEQSMFALGEMKRLGPGDEQADYVASSAWFLKAAELGHPYSQYNLGNAYQKGLGVTQDDEKAVYWWQRAMAQGVSPAAYNLGVQYMYGRGVQLDYDQALKMFQFAAARGHTSARKLLRSWNFEIPELAGSEAGDSEKLAGIVQAKTTNASVPVPSEPSAIEKTSTGDNEQQPLNDVSATDPVTPTEQLVDNMEKVPLDSPDTVESLGLEKAGEPGPKVQVKAVEKPATRQAPAVAMQPESEKPNATKQQTEKPGTEKPESGPSESTLSSVNLEHPVAGSALSKFTAGEAGILSLPENFYTLQLTAMSKPSLVDDFIRQFELSGDLYYYRYNKGDDTFYALSIGAYSSRADAVFSREQLAARDKAGWRNPWLRRVSEVQKLIDEMHGMDQ